MTPWRSMIFAHWSKRTTSLRNPPLSRKPRLVSKTPTTPYCWQSPPCSPAIKPIGMPCSVGCQSLETYILPSLSQKLGGDNHDLASGHAAASFTHARYFADALDTRLLGCQGKTFSCSRSPILTARAQCFPRIFPTIKITTIPVSGLVMAATALADEEPDASKCGIFAANYAPPHLFIPFA